MLILYQYRKPGTKKKPYRELHIMKRIIIAALAFFLMLPLARCNKSGGDSTDYGFSIYPGRVFYGAGSNAAKAHNISFTGGPYNCGPSGTCYAIIYTGVLNGTSYVGIAAEQEDSDSVFTMKIWYTGSLAVGTHSMNSAFGDNVKATIRNKTTGITTIYTWTTGAFNVNITGISGNIYTINSGDAPMNPGPVNLTITSMSALRVQ